MTQACSRLLLDAAYQQASSLDDLSVSATHKAPS